MISINGGAKKSYKSRGFGPDRRFGDVEIKVRGGKVTIHLFEGKPGTVVKDLENPSNAVAFNVTWVMFPDRSSTLSRTRATTHWNSIKEQYVFRNGKEGRQAAGDVLLADSIATLNDLLERPDFFDGFSPRAKVALRNALTENGLGVPALASTVRSSPGLSIVRDR